MHRILLAVMALIIQASLWAQEMSVVSMYLKATDLSASTSSRKDLNNEFCALLKVQAPIRGLSFDGMIVGNTEFKNGEYWVYMAKGAKRLNVKHENYLPLTINFSDFSIRSLDPKKTYIVTMNFPATETAQFRIEPPSAILMVDGEEHDLVDGKATINLTEGDHTYQVLAKGYQSQSNVFRVTKGNANKVIVELDRKGQGASAQTSGGNDEGSGNDSQYSDNASNDADVNDIIRRAEQGDAEAQYALSLLYTTGTILVKPNLFTAFEWCQKAAEQGYAAAQFSMSKYYYDGVAVDPDETIAYIWLLKSAEQGFAAAQYDLGRRFGVGIGVKKSKNQSHDWYGKAFINFLHEAENGDPAAQYLVGIMYHYGSGTEKNKERGNDWFLKAYEDYFKKAEDGDIAAMGYINLMYLYGYGVKRDFDKVKMWNGKIFDAYLAKAQKGDPYSQYMMGFFYSHDSSDLRKGMKRDYSQAYQWFSKATGSGNLEAQYWLGKLYYEGKGVSKNKVMAEEHWRKAAEKGHKESQKMMNEHFKDSKTLKEKSSEGFINMLKNI